MAIFKTQLSKFDFLGCGNRGTGISYGHAIDESHFHPLQTRPNEVISGRKKQKPKNPQKGLTKGTTVVLINDLDYAIEAIFIITLTNLIDFFCFNANPI